MKIYLYSLVTHFMECHVSITIGHILSNFLQLKWKMNRVFYFKPIRKHFPSQVIKTYPKSVIQ